MENPIRKYGIPEPHPCADRFYQEALAEARLAFDKAEVPVGCVVVRGDEVIGRGHNLTETWGDPSAHAEVIAIREASKHLSSWRLTGCVLYVTLEPCLMCASLIKKARIRKVVIGAIEPNEGAFGSTSSINDLPPRGGHIEAKFLMDPSSESLLKDFFEKLRGAE